jgi:hypothetical protein
MELQTLLDLNGLPIPYSYYLLETFLIRLLGKHLEEQGKTLKTHVLVRSGEEDGRVREADAVAPNGIDDIEGPTVIEIKGKHVGQSLARFDDTVMRLDDVAHAGNFKSVLLLVGGPLSERIKKRAQDTPTLRGGARFVIWDESHLDTLIDKYRDFAKNLAKNIDAVRLDNIVARSSSADADKWKEVRAEYVRELRAAHIDNDLALFLGAGVSVGAGVPNWDSLLNSMLANLVRRRDAGTITDEEVQEIVARLRVVDNQSNLMAARYLRRGLADTFVGDITSFLYKSVAKKQMESTAAGSPGRSTVSTLSALARLCIPRRSGPGIRAVVTYNFDDLLEKQLEYAAVMHRPIFIEGEFEARDELAVYHVHGFLPEDRGKYPLAVDGIEGLVFSEEGYHRLISDPYSWSNLIQLALLRDATCLMIGLSLTDPNLRRLLEVSARKNKKFYHYAIMPRLGKDKFMKGKDGVLEVNARPSAVERFLEVHHQIQEEVASELGVKIIWIETFEEIPSLVNSLSTRDV